MIYTRAVAKLHRRLMEWTSSPFCTLNRDQTSVVWHRWLLWIRKRVDEVRVYDP